jgi:hypothetical protein
MFDSSRSDIAQAFGDHPVKYVAGLPIAGSDQIAIQRAIEKYEDIDLQFAGSREGNLLRVHPCTLAPFGCPGAAWQLHTAPGTVIIQYHPAKGC